MVFETSYAEVGSQGLFLLVVLLLAKYNRKRKMPDVALNRKSLFSVRYECFWDVPLALDYYIKGHSSIIASSFLHHATQSDEFSFTKVQDVVTDSTAAS